MKKLKEQEIISNIDDKITEILEILRDEKFSNLKKRHDFAILITQLAVSKDSRARKTIKKLGDFLTKLGNELLGTELEDKELGNNFKMIDEEIKKIKPYTSLFE